MGCGSSKAPSLEASTSVAPPPHAGSGQVEEEAPSSGTRHGNTAAKGAAAPAAGAYSVRVAAGDHSDHAVTGSTDSAGQGGAAATTTADGTHGVAAAAAAPESRAVNPSGARGRGAVTPRLVGPVVTPIPRRASADDIVGPDSLEVDVGTGDSKDAEASASAATSPDRGAASAVVASPPALTPSSTPLPSVRSTTTTESPESMEPSASNLRTLFHHLRTLGEPVPAPVPEGAADGGSVHEDDDGKDNSGGNGGDSDGDSDAADDDDAAPKLSWLRFTSALIKHRKRNRSPLSPRSSPASPPAGERHASAFDDYISPRASGKLSAHMVAIVEDEFADLVHRFRSDDHYEAGLDEDTFVSVFHGDDDPVFLSFLAQELATARVGAASSAREAAALREGRARKVARLERLYDELDAKGSGVGRMTMEEFLSATRSRDAGAGTTHRMMSERQLFTQLQGAGGDGAVTQESFVKGLVDSEDPRVAAWVSHTLSLSSTGPMLISSRRRSAPIAASVA